MGIEGTHRAKDPQELTRRQREVMELMARGWTNYEIARELGVTLEGVKYHVSEILGRYGVESREEAVARWREGRSVGSRARRWGTGLAAAPGLKWAGIGVAVAGLAAAGVVVLAVVAGDGEGDGGPAEPGETPTGTVAGTATEVGTETVGTATEVATGEPDGPPTPMDSESRPEVMWAWGTEMEGTFAWPVVAGNTVFVSIAGVERDPAAAWPEGSVVRVELGADVPTWTLGLDAPAYPVAVVAEVVVFGTADGLVRGVDAATGAPRWALEFPGVPFRAIAAGHLVVVSDLDPGVLWQEEFLDSSSLGGRVWAIEAATGTVAWTLETGRASAWTSTADGRVHVGTRDRDGGAGEVIVLDLLTGTEQWRAAVGAANGPPAVAGGVLVVAGPRTHAFEAGTGRELWAVDPGVGGQHRDPFIFDEVVVLANETEGRVEGRELRDGTLRWSGILLCSRQQTVQAFTLEGELFVLACGYISSVRPVPGTPWVAVDRTFVPQGDVDSLAVAGGGSVVIWTPIRIPSAIQLGQLRFP